jgi:integrase
MSVYKRGGTYWYEFVFNGARIRESAKTTSKTIAREAERSRRRELELGINGLTKRERPPLFPAAAKQWFDSKTALSPLGKAYYSQYVTKLRRHFGNRIVSDITADDIAALQRRRQGQGLSGRQANCEIATLRAILKHCGLWTGIAHRVKMLRERTDTGRALSLEDEGRLLDAVGQSTSPALYPFFVLTLDAGLRPSETRALRRRDLTLTWRNGAIAEGELIVPRSKTEAGNGRVVPLTRRLCAALTLWLSRFADAGLDAFIFPSHHVGFAGNGRKAHLWGITSPAPWERIATSAPTTLRAKRPGSIIGCTMPDTPSSRALPRIRKSPKRRSVSLPDTSAPECSPAMPISDRRPDAMLLPPSTPPSSRLSLLRGPLPSH